jgi:hypothetical protein
MAIPTIATMGGRIDHLEARKEEQECKAEVGEEVDVAVDFSQAESRRGR